MNKYAPKNINKDEAQELYNSGLSLRNLTKHYGCCINTISKLKLKTRSISDSMRICDRKFTKEGLAKLSKTAKENGLGGYRPHPNKGERYNGIWFDSKWEVAVARSLNEFGIIWERPKVGFVWNDAGRKYYPDFYLSEYGVYLDPKNEFLSKKDNEKITEAQKRNNIKVLVLSKEQLCWEVIKTLL